MEKCKWVDLDQKRNRSSSCGWSREIGSNQEQHLLCMIQVTNDEIIYNLNQDLAGTIICENNQLWTSFLPLSGKLVVNLHSSSSRLRCEQAYQSQSNVSRLERLHIILLHAKKFSKRDDICTMDDLILQVPFCEGRIGNNIG